MARRRHDNSLSAVWSTSEQDIMFWHDRHSADGHLMHYFFNCLKTEQGRSFVEELDARGYDVSTLRFSILRKDAK